MPAGPDVPTDPTSRRVAIVVVTAWVVALAIPNLLALPVWTWPPSFWPATGGEEDAFFGLRDAVRALVLGVIATVVILAALGRYGRFALATLPLVLIVPIEAWYIVEYGQPSNAHVLGLIAETNAAEVAEFVGAPTALAMVAAYAIFAALAMLAAWQLVRSRAGWSNRVRIWVLAIALGTFAASAVSTSYTGSTATTIAEAGSSSTASDGWATLVDDFADIFPWGVPIRVADYAMQRRSILAQVERAGTTRLGARLDAARAPVNVVLVIGESARADRFGAGPNAPRTSPRIARRDGVVLFDDVVSPAAATRLAVPHIVAGLLEGEAGPIGGQPSIVAALREAGYRTWWISNHNTVGLHDDAIAPYAEEAQVRRFVNPGSASRVSAFDGVLVDELERALSTPADRRFVVLHMLGSHFNYRFRYPDAFDRFQPSLRRDQPTSIYDAGHREAIRNAYDNSILYSDHVLAELIDALDRTGAPSVLLYVSDHGQVLFEGMCGKAGHGIPSALAYRVPMFVWMSAGMRALRPDAWSQLAAHHAAPLTIASAAPTLADLAAVSVPGAVERASAASASMTTAPRRVTPDGRHWVDFDREIPKIDCATAMSRASPR